MWNLKNKTNRLNRNRLMDAEEPDAAQAGAGWRAV